MPVLRGAAPREAVVMEPAHDDDDRLPPRELAGGVTAGGREGEGAGQARGRRGGKREPVAGGA